MPIQRQGSSFATTLQINGVVNDKTVYCFGSIRQPTTFQAKTSEGHQVLRTLERPRYIVKMRTRKL